MNRNFRNFFEKANGLKKYFHSKVFWLLIGTIGFSPFLFYFIQNKRAEFHYQEGLRFYISGQLAESERELEKACSLNKKDARIKKMLLNILLEQAFSQYEKHHYEISLAAILKAQTLSDQPREMQKMIEELHRKTDPKPESSAAEEEQKFLPKKVRHLSSLDKIAIEFMQQANQRREREMKVFEEELQKERGLFVAALSSIQSRSQKELFLGISLLLLLFSAVLGAFLFFLPRAVSRHFFLELASRPIQPPTYSYGSLLSAERFSNAHPPELLVYSEGKAQKIIAIEAELTSESDGEIAERLLKPFLEDANPWIRAKSAKALYRYNSKCAMGELEKLLEDKKGRIPSVLALGEIGTKDSIDLIVRSYAHFDKETEKAALQMLIKLAYASQTEEDVLVRIQDFLKEVQSKGDWVI